MCVRVCIAEVAFQVHRIESELLTKSDWINWAFSLIEMCWFLIRNDRMINESSKCCKVFLVLQAMRHIIFDLHAFLPYAFIIAHNNVVNFALSFFLFLLHPLFSPNLSYVSFTLRMHNSSQMELIGQLDLAQLPRQLIKNYNSIESNWIDQLANWMREFI